MHKLLSTRKITAVLLVALLSLFSLSSATLAADYEEEKAIKEAIEQLEAEVAGLTSLLKSLTLQVQKVSDEALYDLEEFRPRIFSVEKLTKDNTFEIKKTSGTVAHLQEQVAELADLPEHVYALKNSVASLKEHVYDTVEEINNRIATNELGISQLQAAVEEAVIITNHFDDNLGSIFSRLDSSDAAIGMLNAQIGELQAGLEALAMDVDTGYEAIAGKLGELDGRVYEIHEALMHVDQLAGMVAEFQVQLAEIASRTEKTEVRQAQMQDSFKKLENVHSQIEQLHAQLLVTVRHVEENTRQLAGQHISPQ